MQSDGGSIAMASFRFGSNLSRAGPAALHHHVDVASEEALVPLAAHLDVRFVSTNGNLEVILEGKT